MWNFLTKIEKKLEAKQEQLKQKVLEQIQYLEKKYHQIRKAIMILRKTVIILFRVFNFWIHTITTTIGVFWKLVMFLVIISPYLFWIGFVAFLAFLAYLLITTLYYTQLMPIMSIKVDIDSHGLQNYVYSSDLWDIKWQSEAKQTDNSGYKNEVYKAELLDKYWRDIVEWTAEAMKKIISSFTPWWTKTWTDWIVEKYTTDKLNKAIKEKKLAWWISKYYETCKTELQKDTEEWFKNYRDCIRDVESAANVVAKIDGSNQILRQAEINAYSLVQMKGIWPAYIKDFSNFCTAAGNVLYQAKTWKDYDTYDIEQINNYLNKPYMLGRDTLLWIAHPKINNLWFLVDLHWIAKTIDYKNWKKWDTTPTPTLSYLLKLSLEENYFVSRLWESYFFPYIKWWNIKDSFIAYKDWGKTREVSRELVFNPGEKINEQSLFNKNIYKNKEEKDKKEAELTPEMKKFQEFYNKACDPKNHANFVNMNFLNTNAFALNKNWYVKTFINQDDALFDTFNKTYQNELVKYGKYVSDLEKQEESYHLFNKPLIDRLKTETDESTNINGLVENKYIYFFQNFFFNNIVINSTSSIKSLSQMLGKWGKEKVEKLRNQLNQVSEVEEYNTIVQKLHSMYFLKGTISGKYYVMDYSPLENVYKADPVYWYLTVMNPFPSYTTELDIQDSSISNQKFFEKINWIAINKKNDTYYNVPYINIDITQLAYELWYTWSSVITARYYLYGIQNWNSNINFQEEYYNDVKKLLGEVKLSYNSQAKKLGTYQMIGNNWIAWEKAVEKIFNSDPYVYLSGADNDTKTLYLWLLYWQITKEFDAWKDQLQATFNAFGKDSQLQEKFQINTAQNKYYDPEKVKAIYQKLRRPDMVDVVNKTFSTQDTTKKVPEDIINKYDWTPKKLTFCIKNPITIDKKVPIVNLNLYGLIQNEWFNFISPTTYSIKKLYSVCMEIDNVYIKNSDYLQFLRGNNTLNNDFRIMGKGNMVFTSLYLKEYLPKDNIGIIKQQQFYALKENNLISQLEKQQTKLLPTIVPKKDVFDLPLCQIKADISVSKVWYNTWRGVNTNQLKNGEYSVFDINYSKLFWDQNFWYLYTTILRDNIGDKQLFLNSDFFKNRKDSEKNDSILRREWLNYWLLSEWKPKYRKNIAEPLVYYYKKKVWDLETVLTTNNSTTNQTKLEARLWIISWISDNDTYNLDNITFSCLDSEWREHAKNYFWENKYFSDEKLIKQYLLSNNSEYLSEWKKDTIKKWDYDISSDYWEFFYNPSINYFPYPKEITNKLLDGLFQSQIFNQIKYGTVFAKQKKDTLKKFKKIELFLHLYSWLTSSTAFDTKWNKYFDYIDNLLWRTWWERYNLIFADWNKFLLRKWEDIKIFNQINNSKIAEHITLAWENTKTLLDLIFGEIAQKKTWSTVFINLLEKYFADKIKNFSYSLIMENTIQPTYYDYFWSSSWNSALFGSSMNYFTNGFNLGLKKEMYPYYRLNHLDKLDRSQYTFEAQENTQFILSKLNSNHYFNALWWKYFTSQKRDTQSYWDVYTPYSKFSKIFWKEDLVGEEFAYVDDKKWTIKWENLKKSKNSMPLAYLSAYWINFFTPWDILRHFTQYKTSLWPREYYSYFKSRYIPLIKNLEIDEARIETAKTKFGVFWQTLVSFFTTESWRISWIQTMLMNTINEQASYWVSYNQEYRNAQEDNLFGSWDHYSKKKITQEEKQILRENKENTNWYVKKSELINEEMWIENWLSSYMDFQLTSLSEWRFFENSELWEDYLNFFYQIYYDKNKVQEKILNYLQNEVSRKRYNYVYSKALDILSRNVNHQEIMYYNLHNYIIQRNYDLHNSMKQEYLKNLRKDTFFENMALFLETDYDVNKTSKVNFEIANNDFLKTKDDLNKAIADWKNEEAKVLRNLLNIKEIALLKQLSYKPSIIQYLELIEQNIYINPIISLFKKLPDEYSMNGFEKWKKEMSQLEKAFNSYVLYSNLWNDVKSSPIFNVISDRNELISPLMKLFNPNLSYVLQHLVDKTLIEIKTSKDNNTNALATLSHDFSQFWESFWQVWANNTLTLSKSSEIISKYIKTMYKENKIFANTWIMYLLAEDYFAQEKTMYTLFREFLPHWLILPTELNSRWKLWENVKNEYASRVLWTFERFAKSKDNAFKRISTNEYSALDFLTEKKSDNPIRWTEDTKVPGDWRKFIMWKWEGSAGIPMYNAYPVFWDWTLETLWNSLWVKLPNNKDLNLAELMRTQFYKKLLGFKNDSTWYFYTPIPMYYNQVWQNAYQFSNNARWIFWPLWNALSKDLPNTNWQASLLTKSLNHEGKTVWKISQAQKVLWDTALAFTKLKLPSQIMENWLEKRIDMVEDWVSRVVESWEAVARQDNITLFYLLAYKGLDHIPFYQHHYLTTLLKLRLENQTKTNLSQNYLTWVNNYFDMNGWILKPKEYQKEVADYINWNYKIKNKTVASRYVNSNIIYATWKEQLLQDTADLWKRYNKTVDHPEANNLFVAYPSALYEYWTRTPFRTSKAAFEAILDSQLWYYEKKANQIIMTFWANYQFQRQNMASWALAAFSESFFTVTNFKRIGHKFASMFWAADNLSWWTTNKTVSSTFFIDTLKGAVNIDKLWEKVKENGKWIFREEDYNEWASNYIELLRSPYQKTWFYTYLLTLRELLDVDNKINKLEIKNEDKFYTLMQLMNIISAKELHEIIETKDERLIEEVNERFRDFSTIIDWFLLVSNMNGNFQSATIDEQTLYSDSPLWLKDFSKILGEPQAINDFIFFLYWADYIKSKEFFTGKEDLVWTLRTKIKETQDKSNWVRINIWQSMLNIKEQDIPTLTTELVDINDNIDWVESKKARTYLFNKISFLDFLSYYSLFNYDKLGINYDLYYQKYMRDTRAKQWQHYFNSVLSWRVSWAEAYVSNLWENVKSIPWKAYDFVVEDAIPWIFNLFSGSEKAEALKGWLEKFDNPNKAKVDNDNFKFLDKHHWISLQHQISLYDIYLNLWTMLFAQWRKFDEDFTQKDLGILSEYIRLNDYIEYMYSNPENIEWLQSSIDINQVDEKTIWNSYTIGENLRTNNFALLNYILSQEKYLKTHIFPWNTLDKFTEQNKLNVIAFNYFSYDERKWELENVKDILNALSSWAIDGVDTSKLDWEWFVKWLDNIYCKPSSECSRIISEVKILPGWVAFKDYIKKELNKQETLLQKNKDDAKVKDTIQTLKDLLWEMVIGWKIDTSNLKKGTFTPVWDLIPFWNNEVASCKQKHPDTQSKEFKICMNQEIFNSKIGWTAAWWDKNETYFAQCAWWSNIFRMWNFPDTRKIRMQWDWNIVVQNMTWINTNSVHYSPNEYTIWGIKGFGNTKETTVRYCFVENTDFKNFVPNMIFGDKGWRFWHTWMITDVNTCDSIDSCKLWFLDTNSQSVTPWSTKYVWWTVKGDVGYENKYNVRYSIVWAYDKHWFTKAWLWFADLNRPYTLGMVKEKYWNYSQENMKNFCADYSTNILKYRVSWLVADTSKSTWNSLLDAVQDIPSKLSKVKDNVINTVKDIKNNLEKQQQKQQKQKNQKQKAKK